MAVGASYPPSHHHASKGIAPNAAQAQLSAFLSLTASSPHLHPDAILSPSGIEYPAQSGPQGGLAIHHLKRVEAGLRGENLIAETKEELQALFADDVHLPVGDDENLDGIIAQSEKRGKKRNRSVERVAEWNSLGNSEGTTANGASDGDHLEDQQEWAQAQEEIHGEIGSELAANGTQAAAPPKIKKASEAEATQTQMSGGGGKVDKEARKAAKKQRNLEKKKAKEQQKHQSASAG